MVAYEYGSHTILLPTTWNEVVCTTLYALEGRLGSTEDQWNMYVCIIIISQSECIYLALHRYVQHVHVDCYAAM